MIGLDYSWIKLPRTFCDWRWYKDSHMVLLYLHILLHASFSDKEIGEVVIKRGQMLTSYAPLHTLDLTTPTKDEFVHTVISHLPKELAECLDDLEARLSK